MVAAAGPAAETLLHVSTMKSLAAISGDSLITGRYIQIE
jgi:hypothetical protein